MRFRNHGYNTYRMLLHYKNAGLFFPKIVSIDVSGIPIPLYFLSNNKPTFTPLLNLMKMYENLKVLKMNRAQLTYQPQSKIFFGIPKLNKLLMSDCWLEGFPHDPLIL